MLYNVCSCIILVWLLNRLAIKQKKNILKMAHLYCYLTMLSSLYVTTIGVSLSPASFARTSVLPFYTAVNYIHCIYIYILMIMSAIILITIINLLLHYLMYCNSRLMTAQTKSKNCRQRHFNSTWFSRCGKGCG